MNQDRPEAGQVVELSRHVRRVVAPNPSPMTYWGTNTYLIGSQDLAVIDPGPDSADHLRAILNAVRPGQDITHIFVTHSHVDHSPLASTLSDETGASVYAFGASGTGRSDVMQRLSAVGLMDAGEGVDHDFVPDIRLADGETVSGSDWTLEALWTPGHLGNHLSFQLGKTVFCGDLVMGWASSLVSPPDGDLTDFMASCRRLRKLKPALMHAGHGAPIKKPVERLDWLISHRESREASILEALREGPATAAKLTRLVYTDTPESLMGAATRNVLAHLIDLLGKGTVSPIGELNDRAHFALCN